MMGLCSINNHNNYDDGGNYLFISQNNVERACVEGPLDGACFLSLRIIIRTVFTRSQSASTQGNSFYDCSVNESTILKRVYFQWFRQDF